MKKSLLILSLGLVMLGCGGAKNPAGEKEIYIPCQGGDFMSDKNYFRAFGLGTSNNPVGAMQSAEQMASSNLALDIQRKVEVVTQRYAQNITEADRGEFLEKSEGMSRQIANVNISKTKTICSKTTKVESTGMYKHYICIEMPIQGIKEQLKEKISKETKTTIEVESEKFRAIFDEEMNKK